MRKVFAIGASLILFILCLSTDDGCKDEYIFAKLYAL